MTKSWAGSTASHPPAAGSGLGGEGLPARRVTPTPAQPLSPPASWRFCADAAGPWALCVLLGVLLQVLLVQQLTERAQRELDQSRLALVLQSARDELQADLRSEVPLARNMRAQQLLEDIVSSEAQLLAAEVFNENGKSLFNTDRGSLGESVPDAWLAAARETDARGGGLGVWRVAAPDVVVGDAIQDAHGRQVGHLALTVRPPPAVPFAIDPAWLCVALVAGAVAAAACAWQVLRTRRAALPGGTAAAALARLSQTRARLRDVQARLDRLLGDAA